MQKHGFKKASVLLKKNIQKVSESRGFAQSRVLTHWSERDCRRRNRIYIGAQQSEL